MLSASERSEFQGRNWDNKFITIYWYLIMVAFLLI